MTYEYEFQRYQDCFSTLVKSIALIEDLTTLVDVQVRICARLFDTKIFFIPQELVGIWNLSHHTRGETQHLL